MAVLIACGITLDGKQEIPAGGESEASYTALIQDLKSRGLENVWLVSGDNRRN